MKFAKELDREAVPEWRIKYLNYRAGKKYVKAVARALNRTPRSLASRTPSFFRPVAAHHRASAEPSSSRLPPASARPANVKSQSQSRPQSRPQAHPVPVPALVPVPAPAPKAGESACLSGEGHGALQYGSFVPAPPARHDACRDFALPAPAIRAPPDSPELSRPTGAVRRSLGRLSIGRRASAAAAPTSAAPRASQLVDRPRTLTTGGLFPCESHSHLRRVWTHASAQLTRDHSRRDGGMQQLDLVRERELQFHEFMDSELDKVETFYKLKEEQAGQRLAILREQLHEMRSRRLQEMADAAAEHGDGHQTPQKCGSDHGRDKPIAWVQPFKAKIFLPGPNSKAFRTMAQTPHVPPGSSADSRRDYTRRRQDRDVPYRTAKRKLKLALQELYRSLELLKSYALLNRTAFRKLNKKFDKAANARPPMHYVTEKVSQAWFVKSDVLEGHIRAVEDLYARYFEGGNHKVAVSKLRSLAKKPADESGSSFLSGFLIGSGIVFAAQGLVYGFQLLFNEDPEVRSHTSFLLQLYAGYFLMLLLFALFCIDCAIWTRNKVNYPFIFEFDQRSHIDWRRLVEFPSFFLLLFGIFVWANFSRYGVESLYSYYPLILISITAVIIFFPAPVLGHKSRQWFVYSHFRLLLAGIYLVEFRDFFLGDMYCSLTYSMANIELFFCLYANDWGEPVRCNSNHSRLLGFLMTLPPIWRFIQCLRRYRDTRNVFPHLVNGGKYAMAITASVILSLYRISGTSTNLALYIAFSAINSIYASIWDVFMDFSLLQAHARHFCLRDILALKRRWPYYGIMVLDPVLRFAWIFYAIFTHDLQHSTIVSFLVSLMEVLRRGMWALFRVENEHCANVAQYKASRDVPLPYRIEPVTDRGGGESSPVRQTDEWPQRWHEATPPGASSMAVASESGMLRRRPDTPRTLSKILAEAHKQDFEKRRKSAAAQIVLDEDEDEDEDEDGGSDDGSDDESDKDDSDDDTEAARLTEDDLGPRGKTRDEV